MCGFYEIIYADAHKRYGQSKSWVNLNLRPEDTRSVRESAGRYARVAVPGWVSLVFGAEVLSASLEDNTAGYGQEKLLVNMAVCPRLSVSRTPTEALTWRKNWKCYIFITKCCGFFPHLGI